MPLGTPRGLGLHGSRRYDPLTALMMFMLCFETTRAMTYRFGDPFSRRLNRDIIQCISKSVPFFFWLSDYEDQD